MCNLGVGYWCGMVYRMLPTARWTTGSCRLFEALHLLVDVGWLAVDHRQRGVERQRAREHLAGQRHAQTSGERCSHLGFGNWGQLRAALKIFMMENYLGFEITCIGFNTLSKKYNRFELYQEHTVYRRLKDIS